MRMPVLVLLFGLVACGESPVDDGWTMRPFPVIAGISIPELPASRDLTLVPGGSFIVRPVVLDAAGNGYRDYRLQVTSSASELVSVEGDTLVLARAWGGEAIVRFRAVDGGAVFTDSVRVTIRPLL